MDSGYTFQGRWPDFFHSSALKRNSEAEAAIWNSAATESQDISGGFACAIKEIHNWTRRIPQQDRPTGNQTREIIFLISSRWLFMA